MIRTSLVSLLCLGSIASFASVIHLQPARAASAPATPDSSTSLAEAENTVAQFFPYATPDQQVLMVRGTGTATATAETAKIEFVFVNYDPYYDPYACYGDPAATEPTADSDPAAELTLPAADCPPPDPTPLTRSELQSAIDALVAAGVAESDLEVRLPEDAEDYVSAYSYYPGSASIAFNLDRPTQQRVQELVTAVEEGVIDIENLYFQDRYVQYTLNQAGCDGLEREAYQAAIADARDRATVLASALDVEVGSVPSVADSVLPTTDPFSGSSSSSICDVEQNSNPYSYPSYYDPSLPAEVELRRDVFVTYPVLQR